MTVNVFGRFDALGYFTRLNGHRHADVTKLIALLEQGKSARTSGCSFKPLGTMLHEAVHCFQIASTPFGQFWTRGLLSQALFVSLVFRSLFEDRGCPRVTLPLNTCWPLVTGPDQASVPDGMRAKWGAVDALLAALVSFVNLSASDACGTHGDALRFIYQFGYLDRPEEQRNIETMPPLATAIGDQNACPMWKVQPITTTHLVEAHARLLEGEFLQSQEDHQAYLDLTAQADAAQDTIVLKLLALNHGEIYSYSTELLHTVIALVDLALFTPIDPALAPLWSGVTLWEDIHPAYRFLRAATATEGLGLLTDINDLQAYQNAICLEAGWYTPREIIDALLPRLEPSVSVYDRFFAVCLKERLAHPDLFSMTVPAEQDLVSPILIFDDALVVNHSRFNPPEQSNTNVLQLLQSYGVREIAWQLLFESKISPPEPLLRAELDVFALIAPNFHVEVTEA